MCRLLAYLGPEISFYDLMLAPPHSLEKQAWEPKELRETKLNADGFGFGWYSDQNEAARYRQPIPIWNDPNLKDVTQNIRRKLCLAMVRSATPGIGTSHVNTQPFRYDKWLYMHNGYIFDFAKTARSKIRNILHDEFENNIHGDSDSEYIFALFLHYLHESNDPINALQSCLTKLKEILGDTRALLNIILSDGQTIYATCHAINGQCPTLYYGESLDDYPKSSQILSSEPFNEDNKWQAVKENTLIVMQDNKPIEQLSL